MRLGAWAWSLLIVCHVAAQPIQSIDEATEVFQRATTLYHQGQYAESLELAQRAFTFCDATFGREHAATASTLNLIGMTQHSLGRLPEALENLRKAEASMIAVGDDRQLLVVRNNIGLALRDDGQLPEALEAFRAVDAVYREHGVDNRQALIARNNLATTLFKMGELPRAEALFAEVHTLSSRHLGPRDPMTLQTLDNLAAAIMFSGRQAEALPLTRQATEDLTATLGPNHPATLSAKENLATCLFALGFPFEAEPVIREAYAARIATFGDDHWETIQTREDLGFILVACGQAKEGAAHIQAAYEAKRVVLGDAHPVTWVAARAVAGIYAGLGDYDRAIELLEATHEQQVNLLGENSFDAIVTLRDLAATLTTSGRLEEAETIARRAAATSSAALGPGHPHTISCQRTVITCLEMTGRSTEALELSQATVASARQLMGDDHPETIECRDQLATVLQTLGRLDEAEQELEACVQFWTRRNGPLSTPALEAAAAKANLQERAGKPRQAADQLGQLLAEAGEAYPDDHPALIKIRMIYAACLTNAGELAEAERQTRIALFHETGLNGDASMNALVLTNNLANILIFQNRPSEAESLLQDVITRFSNLAGTQSPIARKATLNLAMAKVLLGRHDEADALLSRVLEIQQHREASDLESLVARRQAAELKLLLGEHGDAAAMLEPIVEDSVRLLGETHLTTLIARQLLGKSLALQGELDAAERELRHTLTMSEEVFGPRSVPRVHTLSTLAATLLLKSEYAEAQVMFEEALEAAEDFRTNAAGDMYASALMTSTTDLNAIAQLYALLLIETDRPALAIGALERARARAALDLLLPQIKVADNDDVTEALIDNERQSRATAFRARERLAQAEPEDRPAARATLESAELEAIKAEQALIALVRDQNAVAAPLTSDQILETWAPSDALVYLTTEGSISVIALHDGRVMGDTLGDAEDAQTLQSTLRQLRRSLMSLDSDYDTLTAQCLDAILPGHIVDLISTAQRIVIVPDGELRTLPLDLIIHKHPKLSDKEVVIAPSASFYLHVAQQRPRRRPASPSILALGDPAFAAQESADSPTDRRDRFGDLAPLPWSGIEARSIVRLVPPERRQVLDGSDATLRRLRADARGRHILHLATHGMLAEPHDPYMAGLALAMPDEPTADDPGSLVLRDLLRSWRGLLDDTDLVVLSACSTNAGRQAGGSQISLPYGFFAAGARTVVASQWPVPDQSTALLMLRFYENLLGVEAVVRTDGEIELVDRTPLSIADALEDAKGWLRTLTWADAQAQTRRLEVIAGDAPNDMTDADRGLRRESPVKDQPAAHPYAHPYYWAPFILIGAPD